MLREETVAKQTLALIKELSANPQLKDFVLVGGTALALQLGHRKSLDIDLFSNKVVDIPKLSQFLRDSYSANEAKSWNNRVVSHIGDIKVDLVAHPHPWVLPVKVSEGIRMASVVDIAAMKVNAIVQSGERLRDFVDLYFILEKMPMEKALNAYRVKYWQGHGVAEKAILRHDRINFKMAVQLMGGKLSWGEVAQRLRNAMIFQNKVYVGEGIEKGKRI